MGEKSNIFENDSESSPISAYRDLYKKCEILSQEERRRRTLESQKKRRSELFDLYRDLSCDDEDGLESFTEEMEVCKNKSNKRRRTRIANILMYSEWLVEIPEDLTDNWYFVPSPIGKRCVVIANKGFTKMFTKWGKFMKKFQSALPSGCKGEYRSDPTILDCIWCDRNSTCYVLDVIVWKGQALNDCDAEFRFFWLKTKFEENQELGSISPKNQCHLEVLPRHLYSPVDLAELLGVGSVWAAGDPQLDGILFFHRNAHYLSGEATPLVGWLKPFMVPEIFGIEVSDSFTSERPENYVSVEQYIQEFESKAKKGRVKKHNMEVDEVVSNDDSFDICCGSDCRNVGEEEFESMTCAMSPDVVS